METERKGIRLIDVMAIVFVIGIAASVFMPRHAAARIYYKKTDCVNNLRQLGTYMVMYVSKYGSDRAYPPAAGQNFFNTLRAVPTPRSAVTQDDGLFVCKVLGTSPSPTALDYRNPNPAAYGAKEMLDGVTLPNYPIVADKTTNHDVEGNEGINVLLFSGSVIDAEPGDARWAMAITQGYTQ